MVLVDLQSILLESGSAPPWLGRGCSARSGSGDKVADDLGVILSQCVNYHRCEVVQTRLAQTKGFALAGMVTGPPQGPSGGQPARQGRSRPGRGPWAGGPSSLDGP